MSTTRNQSFIRLAIIAGIILLTLLLGQVFGKFELVLSVLEAIGLTLIGITILVTIHELGHFLTAKAFGMRVEAFSIGFPPKIFSVKRGDTEYQIGATPLGGYVKISGMIDESFDTEHINSEPQPYEFRSKPVWQRLIVMVGGVVMNILLGIFIFSMIKFMYGEKKIPMSQVKHGIEVEDNTLGSYLGFKTGDKLLSFMGEEFEFWGQYADPNLLVNSGAYFEVDRGGQKVRLDVPKDILNQFSNDSIDVSLYRIDSPTFIQVVEEPAKAAGLLDGDKITMIDSVQVNLFSEMRKELKGRGLQTVNIGYEREGQAFELSLTLDSLGRLGVLPDASLIQPDTLNYGFLASFGPGTRDAFGFLTSNIKGLGQVIRGNASARKSVMGPVQIGKKFHEVWQFGGLYGFFLLTGSLSMILAFVNILPIPALDGGHVVFLLIEGIMRRELPTNIRLIAQQVGMFLILGLMLLIIFNDFLRLF